MPQDRLNTDLEVLQMKPVPVLEPVPLLEPVPIMNRFHEVPVPLSFATVPVHIPVPKKNGIITSLMQ